MVVSLDINPDDIESISVLGPECGSSLVAVPVMVLSW